MPIDSQIPLQVRKPEFMSPAQAISLQSMVQQLQAQKLQQTQALSTMQKQAQIQQRLSQPDAVGPDGLFTPIALSDITKLDASVGTHITGQVQHIKDEQAAAKSRMLSDQANTLKLGESLQNSQKEILESAVSFVDSTMPNASQEEKDRAVRQKVQEGLERQKTSGLYPYTEDQWKNLRQYPYSYGDAKARVTTPQELRKEQKYEERDVPLKGDMIQKEYRDSPTSPWKPLGTPTHRFAAQATMGAAQSVVPEGMRDKHGEDYLKSLPPGIASEVKAVAEYRAPPSALGIRGPQREALIQRVTQYDPNWDFTTYPARQGVRKDFTSGSTARNITAINTALGHIGTMSELANAMQSGNVQTINKAMNRLRSELGNPSINNYEIATSAVANELMRVFRQVGASEVETQEWQKRFSAALTPEQKVQAIKTAAELLQSRIDAIDEQWKRGMGTDKGFPNLLTPKAKGVLDKVGTKDEASGAIVKPYKYDDPEKEKRFLEYRKRVLGY